MEKAESERLPLLHHLDTTHSQLGWEGKGAIWTALTWCLVSDSSFSCFPAGGLSELSTTLGKTSFQQRFSVSSPLWDTLKLQPRRKLALLNWNTAREFRPETHRARKHTATPSKRVYDEVVN